jgi:uncharacterized protein (DUF433 family)
MTTTINIGTLITNNPKICNGKPCIAGTRVKVINIVIDYQNGKTPEEIAQERTHLTLAQIYSALAYYHANKAQIEQEIAEYYAEYLYWENQARENNI